MHVLAWCAIGALLGWTVGLFSRTASAKRTIFDIVAGAMGALMAGGVITRLLGMEVSTGKFPSAASVAIAVLGAAACLAVKRWLTRPDSGRLAREDKDVGRH
jgi:uncharacterized membrane protein YeaQ/YmgE (transglycosylase-associated protein family)